MPNPSSLQLILQQPKQVIMAGPRPLEQRPLGQRFRQLVQTGLLSALLLTQAIQGVSAGNLMTQNASAPTGQALAALVQPQAVNASGMELVNPLEQQSLPGVSLPNGINGMEVVQQWRETDIAPAQLLQLTEVLVMTQSPVIVRNQADKDQVLALALRTQGLFQIQSQEQAADFLARHSLHELEKDGMLIKGSQLANARGYVEPQAEDTFQFWESFSTLRKGGPAADMWVDQAQTPAQFQQAVEALKTAVASTGLNSLKVPLPMWTSSAHLTSVADKLQAAEKELQTATGWGSQVLGLKGNVNLTVGIPYDVALSGMSSTGRVSIQAPLDILGHEWLHGVDYLLAKQVGYQPSSGAALLTEAVHEHGQHAHGPLSQTWAALEKGVDAHTGAWQKRMADQAQARGSSYLASSSYLNSSREKLAYTFDAMLGSTLGTQATLVRQGPADNYSPSHEEAAKTQTVWNQTFASLKEAWWDAIPMVASTATPPIAPVGASSTPFEVSMPSINEWRKARSAPTAVQTSAPKAPVFGR